MFKKTQNNVKKRSANRLLITKEKQTMFKRTKGRKEILNAREK